MTNKELLGTFDDFSERLLTILADSDRLKRVVQHLVEENTRLRLENRQLQDLVVQLQEPQPAESANQSGKRHLEELYYAGFHICNGEYGKSHDTNEGCLNCLELLYREADETTEKF